MLKTYQKHAKSSPDDAHIIPESYQKTYKFLTNYEILSIGKCLFFVHLEGGFRPLVRLKTLLGIISIIWQSMGSWGAILIDSMNDNFFNIKI